MDDQLHGRQTSHAVRARLLQKETTQIVDNNNRECHSDVSSDVNKRQQHNELVSIDRHEWQQQPEQQPEQTSDTHESTTESTEPERTKKSK